MLDIRKSAERSFSVYEKGGALAANATAYVKSTGSVSVEGYCADRSSLAIVEVFGTLGGKRCAAGVERCRRQPSTV